MLDLVHTVKTNTHRENLHYMYTHIIVLFHYIYEKKKTWHNNIMAEKKTQRAELLRPLCTGFFSAGSEVFHLNMLIAVNRQKRLWHMLLSQPTSTTPTTLSFFLSLSTLPMPFWIHFYYHGRFWNKQMGIHQLVLSACTLCEPSRLWENISALTTWQERAAMLEPRSLSRFTTSAW